MNIIKRGWINRGQPYLHIKRVIVIVSPISFFSVSEALRLLEEKSKIVLDTPVSREAIRRALKKQTSTSQKRLLVHPPQKKRWCQIYSMNGRCPWCIWTPIQSWKTSCMHGRKALPVTGDARKPLPMRPGDNQKTDSEYVRNGTCSIFAFVEPLGGTHHVSVRELGLQQLPNRKLL